MHNAWKGLLVGLVIICGVGHARPRLFLLERDDDGLLYDYGPERGPEKWPSLFPTCAGLRQSPVDITVSDLQTVQNAPLLYSHYWNTGVATITNNEHTIIITLNTTILPSVSGGPLSNDEYVFAQMHFHWGANDKLGSEHTLSGQNFSMEAHLVHFKKSYGSLSNASKYEDGLAVVALFLQANEHSTNRMFNSISRGTSNVIEPYSSYDITQWESLRWIHEHTSAGGYFTYKGSLTSPPCSEVVTWIVYPDVIEIPSEQIVPFRKIRTTSGSILIENHRPVQLLHERSVSTVNTVINNRILHHAGEGFARLIPSS